MEVEKSLKSNILDYIGIVLGSFIAVSGINLFLAPHVIAPGGISGLTIVIERLTGIPMFITYGLINIPLLLISYKIFGRDAIIKTIVSVVAFSLALKFTVDTALTNDLLLASIIGGLINGLGVGLVLKLGGTTGGTDLVSLIVHHHHPYFKLAGVMFFTDFITVLLAGVAEMKIEIAIYSTIAAYTTAKGIDFILEGLDSSKSFHIITEKPDEVREIILNEIQRGGTVLEGRGLYTGEKREVLLCVVDKREFPKVKELVTEVDPNVFMLITETQEVFGYGFEKRHS